MADPVSSVAYAIEAALRALGGHLELLTVTMGLVIGIIALVTLNYWQLVRRFPEGGGSPEAAGRAFGEPWSFLPIGALVVDFALTIAISIAAAGSALIAYLPGLAAVRIPLALALVGLVAALTWFGHGGRLIFGVMTCLFIVAAVVTLGLGFASPHVPHGQAPITGPARRSWASCSPSRSRWRWPPGPRPQRRRSPSSASSAIAAARCSGGGPCSRRS
jgi:amino acid transporter